MKMIDTKLLHKLMRETAKENSMRLLGSWTDDSWWREEFPEIDFHSEAYRRVVKLYDFVPENYLEVLAEKVKTEGYDLSLCDPKTNIRKSAVRDYNDPQYEIDQQISHDLWYEWLKLSRDKSKSKREENQMGRKYRNFKVIAPLLFDAEKTVYVRLFARLELKEGYWERQLNKGHA